jgi:hypothetical protein
MDMGSSPAEMNAKSTNTFSSFRPSEKYRKHHEDSGTEKSYLNYSLFFSLSYTQKDTLEVQHTTSTGKQQKKTTTKTQTNKQTNNLSGPRLVEKEGFLHVVHHSQYSQICWSSWGHKISGCIRCRANMDRLLQQGMCDRGPETDWP